MAIEKAQLTHECFPKHSLMGTAGMKKDKETEEEGKQKRMKMKKSKVGTE